MSWRKSHTHEDMVDTCISLHANRLRTCTNLLLRPAHAYQRPATARYSKTGSTAHAYFHEAYRAACSSNTSAMEGNSKVSKRKCAKGNVRGTLGRCRVQEGDLYPMSQDGAFG